MALIKSAVYFVLVIALAMQIGVIVSSVSNGGSDDFEKYIGNVVKEISPDEYDQRIDELLEENLPQVLAVTMTLTIVFMVLAYRYIPRHI